MSFFRKDVVGLLQKYHPTGDGDLNELDRISEEISYGRHLSDFKQTVFEEMVSAIDSLN
jgi:hypothetical protein